MWKNRQVNFYYQNISISDALKQFGVILGSMVGWNQKSYERQFKKKLSGIFGSENIYLLGSARSAIYAILKSLELDQNDEVIVTGFTCEAVVNAVINAGLKPVYADIDLNTYSTSYESVNSKISEKTRVIIAQHSFGIPADLEPIMELAKKKDIIVIEDCAVSLMSDYKAKKTGTYGHASVISLELSKTITSGWGGIAVINSPSINKRFGQLYESVQMLPRMTAILHMIQTGLLAILMKPYIFYYSKYLVALLYKTGVFRKSTSENEKMGKLPPLYLYRLSSPQCFLALKQLDTIDDIKRNSILLANKYKSILEKYEGITLPKTDNMEACNLIRFPFLVNNKEKWIKEFGRCDVEIGSWISAPLSDWSVDHSIFGYTKRECPNAEYVCERIVNLPLHLEVNQDDVEKIKRIVEEVENKVKNS